MYKKFDPITGVPIYELDPIPYIEVTDKEFNLWKEAHDFRGANERELGNGIMIRIHRY